MSSDNNRREREKAAEEIRRRLADSELPWQMAVPDIPEASAAGLHVLARLATEGVMENRLRPGDIDAHVGVAHNGEPFAMISYPGRVGDRTPVHPFCFFYEKSVDGLVREVEEKLKSSFRPEGDDGPAKPRCPMTPFEFFVESCVTAGCGRHRSPAYPWVRRALGTGRDGVEWVLEYCAGAWYFAVGLDGTGFVSLRVVNHRAPADDLPSLLGPDERRFCLYDSVEEAMSEAEGLVGIECSRVWD